jgi:transposase-like protein
MPITPTNPFKGRQYPGEVILLAVRRYLRYPLAYLHIAEILSECGLSIDASCILAMGPGICT